jgi:hypothetical protein
MENDFCDSCPLARSICIFTVVIRSFLSKTFQTVVGHVGHNTAIFELCAVFKCFFFLSIFLGYVCTIFNLLSFLTYLFTKHSLLSIFLVITRPHLLFVLFF